jgi:DNA-binding NarL/FixJ family response regulator
MSVRIAVIDPLPIYRQGILAALAETGLVDQASYDLVNWSWQGTGLIDKRSDDLVNRGRQEPKQVIFLTLLTDEDRDLMAEICHARSRPIVIALLTDHSVSGYLRALSGGASAAVPRDVSPERLRPVFEGAVDGMTVLPVDVLDALRRSRPSSETPSDAPSEDEVSWLRQLAEGMTMSRLAKRSGYSERNMYRLLQELYRRMGVRNRTEALIRAHELGWL